MPRPDAHVLECAFASNPDDLLAAQVWTNISAYLDVKAGVRITRGRTDEFSKIQPSTMSLTLKNDGRFTPSNASSPYYPNVKTGKRIRYGLLRKGNGKQIDTDPTFNGSVPFGGTNTMYSWESRPGLAVTTIASTTTFAQDGAKSMLLTLPTATANNAGVRKIVYGLIVGRQYTASVYIRVPTGTPAMVFACSPGGSSVTTTTNAFQRRTITFTATDPYCELSISNNASSTAGQLVQVDAVQVEEGAAATAFEPNAAVFRWRFTGDANEWPTGWEGGPAFYASSKLTATDRFKRLGDLGEFRTTLNEDLLDDVPFAYYPLNEGAGGFSDGSAGDISGNSESPLTIRQYGTAGTVTFGSAPGVPSFYEGRGTTVAINPAAVNNGAYLRAQLRNAPAAQPTPGSCVNVFAMESVSPLTTGPLGIMTGPDGSWFGVRKSLTSGNITAAYYDGPSDTLYEVASGIGLGSAVAAMYTAVLDVPSAGQGRITFYANATIQGAPVTFTLPAIPHWAVVSVGGRAGEMFRGYLSHAAFFNSPTSLGAIIGWWYSAFRGTDGAGSTAYARLNKLCVYASLETPLRYSGTWPSQNVGPQEIEGAPITAMQLVETTEDGQFFITGEGWSLLRLRNYRFGSNPILTLKSERLDPDALSFRGDDFGLVNEVTATRSDGASVVITNADSIEAHGRRKDQLEAISPTNDALRELAAWRVNVWGEQRNRITGVKISLLNDATVVGTALTVDIGHKIQIDELPAQAPASTVSLFVEGWTEVVSEDEWTLDFNTSPAEMYDGWLIGVPGRSEVGVTTKIGH